MSSFFTVSQAATAVGVSRQYIQQLIDEGRVNAVWMLERWAIPESEVTRVKRERKRKQVKAAVRAA